MARQSGFADFEIELRSAREGFEARVLTSPFGRLSAPFTAPFSPGEMQEVLAAIERRVCGGAAPRDVVRKGDAAVPGPDHDPKALGGALFASLFPRALEVGFREALAKVAARSARGLRLRLSFDRREDFALLATLPWELLFDGRHFLALDRATPVVRSLNLRTQRPQARAVAGEPLRVLLADSRPRDLRSLDTAGEAERIRAALARHPGIEVVHLRHPNVANLRQQLLDERCHVLHFMGHGGFRGDRETVLWFEGDRGRAQPVTGELLADFLRGMRRLRLVVLNSCWGGALPRRQGQDPFTAVAAALMVGGVPAVVAMQFPITDAAAIAFAETFYGRLAAEDSISEAVTEGRLSIRANGHDSLEWATPALFLAGSDRLFKVPPPARQEAVRPPSPGGKDGSGGSKRGGAKDGPARGGSGRSGKCRAAVRPLLLAVRSFHGFVATDEEPDGLLDLTDLFDGRQIRRHEAWQEEAFPRLRDFLLRHAASRRPLILDFAAHASLAFAAGYCLEAKSGLDITLLQRGRLGTAAWRAEAGPAREGPLWIAADRRRDAEVADVALAASVTWPILDEVEHYLASAQIAVGRLIPMTLSPRPSPTGVAGGLHAMELAQELTLRIRERTMRERAAVLHLFTAAPNAVLFYLGQMGRCLGTVQLYEHGLGSEKPGDYQPGLRLPLPRPMKAGAGGE
jgi:hypothetical protein